MPTPITARLDVPDVHPVQMPRPGTSGRLCKEVVLAAYQVYCELHGEQEAMVTGGCRGGFHVNELIPLLYARAFPREQWRAREQEAARAMQL